jgi:hypothetical protein
MRAKQRERRERGKTPKKKSILHLFSSHSAVFTCNIIPTYSIYIDIMMLRKRIETQKIYLFYFIFLLVFK